MFITNMHTITNELNLMENNSKHNFAMVVLWVISFRTDILQHIQVYIIFFKPCNIKWSIINLLDK